MSNGQTIIKYGDVVLYRCLTRRIEQRPVMDSANASLKCWRFVVHVTAYLHGFPDACKYHSLSSGPGDTDYSLASQAHKQVRWRLPPRQRFVMAVGCTTDIASGNTLLYAEPMTNVATPEELEPEDEEAPFGLSLYDVADGPRCLQFDVSHVSGDSIFKVDATFEIHRVQCDDDDGAVENVNGVLSHRWSSADALDVNLRTTRTYTGQLELATSNFSPHWFRHLVVPPIQEGMRRQRLEFMASADGRKLQYTITDQSIAVAAPPPARRWSVEHTEASIGQDGLKQAAQVSVSLEGDENVDKGQLIVLGLYVVFAKMQGSKPGQNPAFGSFLMNDITITELTGDVNGVRVSASGWRIPGELKDDPGNPNGVHVNPGGLNTDITAANLPAFAANYDPRRSADGRAGEAAPYQGPIPLAGIFRCYLQSPCSSITGINIRTNLTPDLNTTPDDEPQVPVYPVIVPSIDADIPDYYSTSHQTSMYTTWQMESRYDTRHMRAAMPIASAPYAGGGFDTSPACSIVSLSRPQCRRIVRIQAERVGEWPEFPNSEAMEDGFATVSGTAIAQKVLQQKLLGGTVTKSCNGEDLYRARMEIVFALLRAPDPTESLKFGNNKWATSGQAVSTTTLTNSPYS